MGRLTMNMLMSFAEFEREMISERTRDKIAGARRKGKWTGGPVPYGYSVKDKKLLVNELEARVVREAFDLFLITQGQGGPKGQFVRSSASICVRAYQGASSGVSAWPSMSTNMSTRKLPCGGHRPRRAHRE